MENSDTLNLILASSCILLSKKKQKKQQQQLPRNYYKTTLYASLISNSKHVSVCVRVSGVGRVGGCTGCFTKTTPKLNPNFETT